MLRAEPAKLASRGRAGEPALARGLRVAAATRSGYHVHEQVTVAEDTFTGLRAEDAVQS